MSEEKEDDWDVKAKRYVGYIDIMGFKDMVARSTHDEIYEMMKKIDKAKNHVIQTTTAMANLNLVKTTTYSDSIMLYSKDDSYNSLLFISLCISALTHKLLIENIPHKGALAFGEMTLDFKSSIFFGQPLIDAYLLQDELIFYGIILHATAQKEIETIHLNMESSIKNLIKNYLCPLKNGTSKHLTIQPLYTSMENSQEEFQKEESKKLFESIQKLRYITSGHLRKYIDNTEIYLEKFRAKK